MTILSLILARGGSKSIPKKNITLLQGKPLLHYSATASLSSNAQETWVSTDCPDIKRVAIDIGCKVIDRPANISGDNSKSDEALVHFADNVDFDILVFIQPTSPLITAQDINIGLEKMREYDSVFSVCKEHWVPRWTLNIKPFDWNINNRPMRQDIEEKYIENGAFYITTREQLLKTRLRYGGKMSVVEMPPYRSFQIDTPEDLLLLEKIA